MRDLKNYLTAMTKPIMTDFGLQENAVFTVDTFNLTQFGINPENKTVALRVIGFPSEEVANRDGVRLPLGELEAKLNFIATGEKYDEEVYKRPLTQLVIANAQKSIMRSLVTGKNENGEDVRFLEDATDLPLPAIFEAFQSQIDAVLEPFYQLETEIAEAISQAQSAGLLKGESE